MRRDQVIARVSIHSVITEYIIDRPLQHGVFFDHEIFNRGDDLFRLLIRKTRFGPEAVD